MSARRSRSPEFLRRRWPVLCVALALLAGDGVSSHSELLRSEPLAGAILSAAPTHVRLTFSARVDVTPDSIIVFAPDGTRVSRAAAPLEGDPAVVETAVGALAAGTHLVRWRVLSLDGHPIDGTFEFSIAAVSATTEPREIAAQPNAIWPAAARALHLAALAALIGPLVFMLAARPTDLRVRQQLWRLMGYGALALIPAAALMLFAQSSALAGSLSAGLQWGTNAALLGTRWGSLWIARTGVATAIVVAVAWGRWRHLDQGPSRRALGVITAAAAILLVLTALNGHSAATSPVWLSVAVDWIHLAAAAAWLGGIAALVTAVLPAGRTRPQAERDAVLAPLVSRFSTVALICVELLVVTGLYQAWVHIDAPAALTSTEYGRTLLVKLALVSAMMLPAAVNLLVLRPRIQAIATGQRSGDSLFRGLRWTVGAEMVLGAIVLVVVGRLTSIPPARVEAAALSTEPVSASAEPSMTLGGHVGTTLVLLTVSPMRAGTNRLELELQGPSGRTISDAQVRLRISPPGGTGISPWSVVPAVDGSRYRATVALAPEGPWRIDVSVSGAGTPPSAAAFTFDVPARVPGSS